MESLQGVVILLILFVLINLLGKGLKAGSSGQQQARRGQVPPPGAPGRRMPRPPLTPVARPGGSGAPDWSEIMTMLSGQAQQAQPPQPEDMEGASTEFSGPSGSITGASMMDGSPSMIEGPGMMEGSPSMMGEGLPDSEGQAMPGELSAGAIAAQAKAEELAAPPLKRAARPGKYDPAALRDAVVWAEILAKPKSLRRVAR